MIEEKIIIIDDLKEEKERKEFFIGLFSIFLAIILFYHNYKGVMQWIFIFLGSFLIIKQFLYKLFYLISETMGYKK